MEAEATAELPGEDSEMTALLTEDLAAVAAVAETAALENPLVEVLVPQLPQLPELHQQPQRTYLYPQSRAAEQIKPHSAP